MLFIMKPKIIRQLVMVINKFQIIQLINKPQVIHQLQNGH